ncbi:MAG: NUDIX domain-containing protein [Bacteroidetes bacterium]|nr:NUDIX domain-containing protein [Bacteroidota bacterium]
MERKIYFNSNYIIVSDCKNTQFSHTIYECANKTDVQNILKKVQPLSHFEILIYNPNFEELFSWFAAEFVYIEAAGGLVKSTSRHCGLDPQPEQSGARRSQSPVFFEEIAGQARNDEYLFIYRNDFWDLPKGKFEKNETPEQAALREVQEETGLQQVMIDKFLCSTWHTYPYKGKIALKQTYWYAMTAPKEQQLTPQTEEGISEILWLNNEEIMARINEMYASVKDVAKLI